RLAGDVIGEVDERGDPIRGDTTLLLLNAHHEPIQFTLPATRAEHHWERLLDTWDRRRGTEEGEVEGGQEEPAPGRSLVLLTTRLSEEAGQAVSRAQAAQIRRERRRPQGATRLAPGGVS